MTKLLKGVFAVAVCLLIGTVGSMDTGALTMGTGFAVSLVWLAVMAVCAVGIRRWEK